MRMTVLDRRRLRAARARMVLVGLLVLVGLSTLVSGAHSHAGASAQKPGPRAQHPGALEKTVLAEDLLPVRTVFSVNRQGTRLYFAYGGAYYVFDAHGDLTEVFRGVGDLVHA